MPARVPLPFRAFAFAAAAALGSLPGAWNPAGAQSAPSTVTVHTDQVAGRFVAESVTNISFDGVYGQLTSSLSEPGLAWVRAGNAVSHVRCPAWLGDGVSLAHPEWQASCSVVRVNAKGEPVVEWDRLERVLDVLVSAGLKPVIVCGGLPDALLEGPVSRNEAGAAINRPRELARYGELITQMFRRLMKTYGPEEVHSWYFEVWNAPDHGGSWLGGGEAPFADPPNAEALAAFNGLYDQFAIAAETVDPKLRIGGPGLAGDLGFLRGFLDHCAKAPGLGGKRGLKLDFVSWQRYGTVSDIVRWNAEVRGVIDQGYPEFKSLPCILCESGAGAVEGSRANSPYEAARQAALIDANVRAEKGVDLIFRSGDLIDDHFDGFRPLITRLGADSDKERNSLTVPLPAFRLNTLLAKMGVQRLKVDLPAASGPTLGVLATAPQLKGPGGAIQALVYRYDPSLAPGSGTDLPLRLKFTGLSPKLLRLPLRIYRIDGKSASPYDAWVAAERPRPAQPAFAKQFASDRPFAPDNEKPKELPPGVFVNSGEAAVDLEIQPNSVTLVTLGAEPNFEVQLSPRGERLLRADEAFGAAVDLVRGGDPERGLKALKEVQNKYADTWWRVAVQEVLVTLYEVDRKSPDDAEAARRELLNMPIDDFRRLRLLERLRVDATRKKEASEIEAFSTQISQLERRLVQDRGVGVRGPRWHLLPR